MSISNIAGGGASLTVAPARTEVRVTDPTTGAQKGSKLARWDLMPLGALNDIAEVYGFGATKYSDHNWRKGYKWGLSFAAMLRHIALWQEGHEVDEESGLNHLAHAGWHILALLTFMREHPEMDDRFSTAGAP